MRTRLPYPRIGKSDFYGNKTFPVADAAKVTANYVRLVEKVNGRLSGDDLAKAYKAPTARFLAENAVQCYSFLLSSTTPTYNFYLPTGAANATLLGWALSEIQDFNSSRRPNGRLTQFGWNSAVTANLKVGGATVSTIQRNQRLSVSTSGSRGGLPDNDVILTSENISAGSVPSATLCQVQITTTLPSNGGYLVYVFYKVPWSGTPTSQ